jgi:hypothetical protein
MASFATLLCVFLSLLSSVRADVLYVVGDEVVSVTDQGFSGLSGTKASCSGVNTAKAMASYLAGPKTVVVPVTVSLCGSYLSSDVVAGLDWIEGDIDSGATNHVAIGVNLDKIGAAASVVDSQIAGFVSNRAVVSTMQGYWSKAPKGVLLVPNATVAPPPQPSPSPSSSSSPSPGATIPAPVEPECDPVWKRIVVGQSAVLAAALVVACFALGAWYTARKRGNPGPPLSYASQSHVPPVYPMYQHESIRMPPFVGASSPPPERETLSTPDLEAMRAFVSRGARRTSSSPDVLTTRWAPDGGAWEHIPTPHHRPHGDQGVDDSRRVSISMSGIREVNGAVRREERKRMFDGPSDKEDKTRFDFRRRGSGNSPETMSSSRETPTNLSERTSKPGSC